MKVELTLPDDLWRFVDHVAEFEGVTPDEIVCRALEEYCHRRGIVFGPASQDPADV